MPNGPTDPDLDALLADLALVGPDGLLQRVVRLAAYGLIERESRILLCRVAPGYAAAGKWTLPGGGLAFGEAPETGAIREVEEETGLIATVTGPPLGLSDEGSWPYRGGSVPYHQVRFVYPMEVTAGEERVEIDGSTDAFGWFGPDEMRELPIVGLVSRALEGRPLPVG